jgi:basic amino acid/polyamine antiporter, APA family
MIVVANMIGAGVFTSLGFQVLGLSSGYSIIWLWLLGGIVSLFGAGCYAEIATRLKGSGGEYNFLSQIYNKPIGFAAGWISFTVGFSAPIAAACIALGTYFSHSLQISNVNVAGTEVPISKLIAINALLLLTILQLAHKKIGAIFQNITTTFKIAVVLIICVIGFYYMDSKVIAASFGGGIKFPELTSGPFFISLFFVSYAYSGWNASAYIAGEIDNPKRNIPRSLILGTLIVTILYVLLNVAFMLILPFDEIKGQEDVGRIFANKIFGGVIGGSIGLVISILLVSSISSMIITGPRVTKTMGENHALFKWFSKSTATEIPQRAILVQSLISLLFIITSSFESVIVFIGFTLNIFTLLTVFGLFILRAKDKKTSSTSDGYKVFGYPFVPIIFILIYLFMLVFGLYKKPVESFVGLGFALLGVLIYVLSPNKKLPKPEDSL